MIGKKTARQQKLAAALAELPTLQSELAFEQITIELSDEGRHWQFKYGDRRIADYWPASSLGHVIGYNGDVRCISVAQAQRMAMGAKWQLFGSVARALRQPAASEECLSTPHG